MIETKNSSALLGRAAAVIPGAVNSPVRASKAVGGATLFIASGDGPTVIDADGNRFIDYVGSYGPAILGHAHPEVVAAIAEE
ncbi:MAG TPA: aminotransferase class III-fold pyridoxal phosphate-dependent enzyme, partial [Candidatus Binataceae bacterium]